MNDWKRYKSSQNVKKTEDICNQLLNCCSEEVRESLDNARGVKVDQLEEKDLLAKIKKAAVKSVNNCVHRRNFHKMSQEEGENFDHWVTRLTKNMRLCDYNLACNVVNCTHEHNYGPVEGKSLAVA